MPGRRPAPSGRTTRRPTGRRAAPTGAPVWDELATHDVDAAVAFYTALFGWTFESHARRAEGLEECGVFLHDGEPVAGIGPAPDGASSAWHVYLLAPDVEATVEAVRSHGGQVVIEPEKISDGTVAVVADPEGTEVGLWAPERGRGTATPASAGTAVWSELLTVDYPEVAPFYTQALGWTGPDPDEPPDDGGAPGDPPSLVRATEDAELGAVVDGSGFLPDAARSAWSVYVGTQDTDEVVARAVELGGSVLVEATDTPYGRTAVLLDPTGAPFRVTSV